MRKLLVTAIVLTAMIANVAHAENSSSEMTDLQAAWGTDKRVFTDKNKNEVLELVDSIFREDGLANKDASSQTDLSSTAVQE